MFIFTTVKVALPGKSKERWFSLDTDTLAPLEKHRIELLIDSCAVNGEAFRGIRMWFQLTEEAISSDKLNHYPGEVKSFSVDLHSYWESDDGSRLTEAQAIRIVTQNPNLRIFPPGTRQHDVTLALTDNSPVPNNPLAFFQLTQSEVNGLALFLRDIKELRQNPFYERHATMRSVGKKLTLETISVDLIRSFITIFRRLYMSGKHDVGNFRDSCEVYCSRFWVLPVV